MQKKEAVCKEAGKKAALTALRRKLKGVKFVEEEGKELRVILTGDLLRMAFAEYSHMYQIRTEERPFPLSFFYDYLDRILADSDYNEDKDVINFCAYVKMAYPIDEIYQMMLAEGRVGFDLLRAHFKIGDKICYTDEEGDICGGEVTGTKVRRTFFGSKFEISYQYIKANGSSFIMVSDETEISEFSGAIPIDSLPIRHLDDATLAELTERGRKYVEIATSCNYMHHQGHLVRRTWWSAQHFTADGRVMIDMQGMRKIDHDYVGFRDRCDHTDIDGVDENKLWMCIPYVYGFSFACKMWGELRIRSLSKIKFDTQAFDTLVLDPEMKKLILALIKHSKERFNDVITGKSGGSIFLLHGKPGTGKTLTAEATAELLKRPLYSVSIGELGVNPDELEKRLRLVLEMAASWNAVLLLDEADIFLEARDEKDIVRNAMVGIFLRLLEYHQGVMFLTTNRVRNIDAAMVSRISLAIDYPDHDAGIREQVWSNLFAAAGITGIDTSKFAEYELNGRQVQKVISNAMALAADDGKPVGEAHIVRCLKLAEKFFGEIQGEVKTPGKVVSIAAGAKH